jgi:hypothetical protein
MTPDEYSRRIQSGTKLNTEVYKYPEIYVNQATGEVNIPASKARFKYSKNPISNTSAAPGAKKSWMTPKDYAEKFPVTNKDTFKYPELLVDENGVIDFISTKQ